MNKYIALLSLVIGVVVFAIGISVALPRPMLRVTEDSAITANYLAPDVVFMGEVPRVVGKAHTVRTVKYTSNVAESRAEDSVGEGPFGKFSTLEAMRYRTLEGYHSRVPNIRVEIGQIRYERKY
jgi:hypothetical protein